MSDISTVLTLVQSVLHQFSSSPLSATIRDAIRVARLLEDYEDIWWLDWEMRDLTKPSEREKVLLEVALHIAEQRFNALLREYDDQYVSERLVWSKVEFRDNVEPKRDKVLSDGVQAIERRVLSFRGLAPQLRDVQRLEFQLMDSHLQGVLERIAIRVHTYLSRVESRLLFALATGDVFDEHEAYINRYLEQVAPEVLAMFKSCYERIASGEAEALHQATATCRRILKAVADHVYPARSGTITGTDGTEHEVGDDDYVNRLLAYAGDKLAGRSKEILNASLRDLANRLKALNDLASKGVHASAITRFEARQCAMQTYVVAADILHLEEDDEEP